MKKLFIIGFIVCSLPIYAFDVKSYWTFGDVKIGGVFKKTDPKAIFDLNISAFKFHFYDRNTGLNFSLSPFYIDIADDINKKETNKVKQSIHIMSLINTELAFNTLYHISDTYALNLFTSFHVIDPTMISRFQFNAGLEFAITSYPEIFSGKQYSPKAKLLSIRSGFRYTYTNIEKQQPSFFLDIGIDMGSFLLLFKNDYERELKDREQRR